MNEVEKQRVYLAHLEELVFQLTETINEMLDAFVASDPRIAEVEQYKRARMFTARIQNMLMLRRENSQ
jgi:hypothetical protein